VCVVKGAGEQDITERRGGKRKKLAMKKRMSFPQLTSVFVVGCSLSFYLALHLTFTCFALFISQRM
jgi:hypothetical protein